MQGDAEIIEVLNEVLTAELTAVNQYFLHGKLCANWGYNRLAEHSRHESIDEMKHAERVTDRIIYLEGFPNYQRYFPLRIGETVPEQFEADRALEVEAIDRLNRGIELARRQERQRHPRAVRRHPRRRGGARRLAGDATRDDPPDRPRELPRAAVARRLMGQYGDSQ